MQTGDIHLATEHILELRNYPRKPAYLAAALEDVFVHFGHIPEIAKPLLSSYFNITVWPDFLSDNLLHAKAGNVKIIKVCEGPCCRKTGSDQLAEALQAELHVSVERHHCMGNCHEAPCATVNGEVVSRASLTKIKKLLQHT